MDGKAEANEAVIMLPIWSYHVSCALYYNFSFHSTHLFMLGSFHQDLALSVLSRTWKMSVLLKSGTLLNVTALNTLILFRFCIKIFCMFPSKLSVIPTVSKCALLFFFLLVLYFFICMLHSPVVGYPFMSLISFFYCHLPNCLTIKLNTHTHWTLNLLVSYLFFSFFPYFETFLFKRD